MRRFLGIVSLTSAVSVWLACGGTQAVTPGTENDASASGDSTSPGSDAQADTSTTTDGGSKDVQQLDVYLGPSVNVRFGNCGTFSACGGDPAGTFKISDICVDTDAVLSEAKAQCPNIAASNWSGKGAGGLTVAGTNWASQTQTNIGVDIVVPGSCTQGLGCNLLALALKQRGFDTATCKDNATAGCDCSVTTVFDETSNGGFTQNGSRITTSSGSQYDYCRSGSIVTVNPQSDKGGPTPIIYTYSL